MKYLSAEDILRLHDLVVEKTGGLHGIRDHDAVKSLEAQPKQVVFGKELYPTAFEKAAVYAHRTICNHPFLDGNKRTGMTLAAVFLEDNGFAFVAREGELEQFALQIIEKRLEVPEIGIWFKKHSRPAKPK